MLKIGITGGIGSGKSTACKVFELLNIPVFYADQAAKDLMNTDPKARQALLAAFGPKTYREDGSLNREYLAKLVFNDEAALKHLNQLVHPLVFKAFDNWVVKQSAFYVVKEAALLFESDSYKLCDQTILIKAPEKLKIARIKKRDKASEADILARMARQLSDEEKEKRANFVLLNDEQRMLIPQILQLHEHFLALAAK